MNNSLPAYTWDQAHILGLATARGFNAIGIPASTVRRWASQNIVGAVGKAPGGAHLYLVRDVSQAANRERATPGRRRHSRSA